MNRLISTAMKTAFGQTFPLPVMRTIINQAALPRRNMTTSSAPPTNTIINTFYRRNMAPNALPRTNIASNILSRRTVGINAASRTSMIMTTLFQRRMATSTLPRPSTFIKTLPRTNTTTKMVQLHCDPIHADFKSSKRLSSGDCEPFLTVFLLFLLWQVICLRLDFYGLERLYKQATAEKIEKRSNMGSTDNKP